MMLTLFFFPIWYGPCSFSKIFFTKNSICEFFSTILSLHGIDNRHASNLTRQDKKLTGQDKTIRNKTGQDKQRQQQARKTAERPLVASPDRTTSVTRTQSALEGNLSILSLPGVDLGTLPLTHVVKDARGQPQSRLQREFFLHTFERPH